MSSDPFDQPAGLGDRLDDLLLQAEAWVARSRPAVMGGLMVVLAVAIVWWTTARSEPDEPIEASIPMATVPVGTTSPPVPPAGAGPPGSSASMAAAEEVLVVHVVGAVRRPGLVTLRAGDRLSDAVAAAGGGRSNADLARLNLASPVVDGMQVRVPALDETDPGERPLVQLPALDGAPDVDPGATSSGPVDVNRATEADLQALPGIGPALAARIVEWRDENGGFAVVDDLESVPGIGPAKLADLRDLVVV